MARAHFTLTVDTSSTHFLPSRNFLSSSWLEEAGELPFIAWTLAPIAATKDALPCSGFKEVGSIEPAECPVT